ncbi:MAG: hypothetical protein JWN84_3452, partial [Nocardioides sp.]|nr:hypothetical protein [Nocardioides sp.]
GATRVVVDDPADPRAHIDMRRVTFRVGAKMAGFAAVVDDLPRAGSVYVTMTTPGSDDSVDLLLERTRGGTVSSYAEYNFLEDAGGPVRCRTTHQWDQDTDVIAVSVSRGCITKYARMLDRPFSFDRLDMEVSTYSRGDTNEDDAGPVRVS